MKHSSYYPVFKRSITFCGILFCLFLFSPSNLYGQLDMAYGNSDPKTPTWESYQFVKYGNVGASLYTGSINYSVPFYTYKDNDFELPISFDYTSNGYVTNSHAGVLGHDWRLNVGGVITREIRGVPDDMGKSIVIGNNPSASVSGFHSLYKAGLAKNNTTPELGGEWGSYSLYFYHSYGYSRYEPEPDLFHFQFLGYSGSFYFWYDGEVKVFTANGTPANIKVEADDNYLSLIRMITPDGYIYTFSKEIGVSEYVEKETATNIFQHTFITWKLTEIKAPNNRIVSFVYTQNPINQEINKKKRDFKVNYYKPKFENNYTPPNIMHAQRDTAYFERKIDENLCRSYLSQIVITGGTEILFSYTGRSTEKEIVNNQPVAIPEYTPLLSNIEVRHNWNDLRRVQLLYENTPSPVSSTSIVGNITQYLKSININSEEKHSFEYYMDKRFPYFYSCSSDHWGYYNGKNDTYNPVDFTELFSWLPDGTEFLNSNLRNPDASFARLGMLKRINYPTGGYSLIEYEGNSYSKEVKRIASNQFIPELTQLSGNEPAGGLRVKRIAHYERSGVISSALQYSYVNSSGLSSGILLRTPRYGISYVGTNVGVYSGPAKVVQFYSSNNTIYNYGTIPLEYTRVIEQRNDGASTIYEYTNYEDYPDEDPDDSTPSVQVPTYSFSTGGSQYATDYFSSPACVRAALIPPTSMQAKRGHLKSKDYLSSSGTLLRREAYQYLFSPYEEVLMPRVFGDYWNYVKQSYMGIKIAAQTITDYTTNGAIVKDIRYEYNAAGQLAAVKNIIAAGDTLSTRYRYVTDVTTTSGSIYAAMKETQVLDYPWEVSSYRNSQFIKGSLYTFGQPDADKPSLFRPSTILQSYPDLPWSIVQTLSYDTNGNLVERTDKNGLKTTYLWSYNHQLLVGKLENASSDEVYDYLTTSPLSSWETLSNLSQPTDVIMTALKALQNNFSASAVTVYKQEPYVGISEKTTSGGITYYYEYDNSGRIKWIYVRDEHGLKHYLNGYKFHYQEPNATH
jgi:hypothetical protein